MPSTFDPLVRLELQATGENASTWGDKANSNFTLIAQAIAGHVSVNIAGLASYSLITADASVDEARNSFITFNGLLTQNCIVYVPPTAKNWFIRDNTTGAFTINVRTSAGTGVSVIDSGINLIITDGVSCYVGAETNRVNKSGDVMTGGLSLAVTTVSASKAPRYDEVQALIAAAIPSGTIAMWSGSIVSIPAAWTLCDGTAGTPDLRDRFVIGAGSTYAVADVGGTVSATSGAGGDHSHGDLTGIVSLTSSQIPAHTHSVSVGDPTHAHTITGGYRTLAGADTFGSFGGNMGQGSATAATSTGITVEVYGGGTGGGHEHAITSSGTHTHVVDVRPPYYALAYIMKI